LTANQDWQQYGSAEKNILWGTHLVCNKVLKKLLTATLCLVSTTYAYGDSARWVANKLETLRAAAPQISDRALSSALNATQCATRYGMAEPQRLAIIDFSLPSSEKRLWIFDLAREKLVLRDLVAHGKNSGEAQASAFSNIEGSHQSSLGLFRAAETYHGKHGYSLRLDGLEDGINDQARQRAIVIHGADYVAPKWIKEHGRLGRSFGCPAVRKEIAHQVVDNLKNGQFVFSYYPDQDWAQTSSFLNCDAGALVAKPGKHSAANS